MIAHEYANLFPMLSDADLQGLADDIAANGLQTPITTLDGVILDGRNRYRACELAGVDPVLEEYQGGDPLGFVISHNLHRRHLTEPQRAMVGAKLANLPANRPQESSGIPLLNISQPVVVSMMNVSTDSVKQARKIAKQGSPELNEAVMQGGVSLAAAVDVSSLPHEEQAAIVAKGMDAVKAKAKEIRQQASEPQEEPETVVIDGTQDDEAPSRRPPLKIIESEGMRIWLLAKSHLDRINKHDEFRVQALQACAEYCQKRITAKK
jgi:hypothetical protein